MVNVDKCFIIAFGNKERKNCTNGQKCGGGKPWYSADECFTPGMETYGIMRCFQKFILIIPFLMVDFVLFSVITGWETCNKYQIKNSVGQQVYFAAEGRYEHEI